VGISEPVRHRFGVETETANLMAAAITGGSRLSVGVRAEVGPSVISTFGMADSLDTGRTPSEHDSSLDVARE
jgi:hypothetical protein